jgi:hypothetical protein
VQLIKLRHGTDHVPGLGPFFSSQWHLTLFPKKLFSSLWGGQGSEL